MFLFFFFFTQKTAYEIYQCDWSSDVCSSDLVEILWLAALSLEDGDLSSSLERLRTAEEALRRALESGTDEDVRRAMDELRAAMQEYLDEMIRQALERGLEPGDQDQGNARQLSQQDLEDMLDELQRRAESGLRDQARDMLSELSRLPNNPQAGRPQQHSRQQRPALLSAAEFDERSIVIIPRETKSGQNFVHAVIDLIGFLCLKFVLQMIVTTL